MFPELEAIFQELGAVTDNEMKLESHLLKKTGRFDKVVAEMTPNERRVIALYLRVYDEQSELIREYEILHRQAGHSEESCKELREKISNLGFKEDFLGSMFWFLVYSRIDHVPGTLAFMRGGVIVEEGDRARSLGEMFGSLLNMQEEKPTSKH